MPIDIAKLTDREVVDLIQSDVPLARARLEFSKQRTQLEQAEAQHRFGLGHVEMCRAELVATQEIIEAFSDQVRDEEG